MSYDLRVIIGMPHVLIHDGEPTTLQTIAEMELGSVGFDEASTRDVYDHTTYGIYTADGTRVLTEDGHSRALMPLDIEKFMDRFRREAKGYRRLAVFEALVLALQTQTWDRDIVYLAYGH